LFEKLGFNICHSSSPANKFKELGPNHQVQTIKFKVAPSSKFVFLLGELCGSWRLGGFSLSMKNEIWKMVLDGIGSWELVSFRGWSFTRLKSEPLNHANQHE